MSENSFNGKVVIIGASSSGISAAQTIRKNSKNAEIVVCSEESDFPYYRPYLTEFIGNPAIENKSNFYLNKESWYGENNINLMLNQKVTEINPFGKVVKTASGHYISYDKLIIACGSKPFVPLKDALNYTNVFAIRTIEDARKVQKYLEKGCKKAVIIGGGLLGLEAANSLNEAGLKVSVVEFSQRILPMQLDEEGSVIFEKIVKGKGVDFIPGVAADAVISDDLIVRGVKLNNGSTIEADIVIFSVGIRANTELALNCRIEVNKGIVVNERMETSIPDIFACGDVAEFAKIPALWMPALKMGKVAGLNAIGEKTEFLIESYPAALNSFGTRIYSAGDVGKTHQKEDYVTMQRFFENSSYRKLFFYDGKLVGGILLGDISKGAILSKLITSATSFDEASAILY